MRRKIIKWLIGKLLPNYHLSRNPPKGIKRPGRLQIPIQDKLGL